MESPGGMGCRYNPYGEKVEEGLYLDGELAKSYEVAPKKMPLLPENPENPAYEAYRKGPGIWNRTVGLRRNLHRRPEKRPSERPGDPSAGRP